MESWATSNPLRPRAFGGKGAEGMKKGSLSDPQAETGPEMPQGIKFKLVMADGAFDGIWPRKEATGRAVRTALATGFPLVGTRCRNRSISRKTGVPGGTGPVASDPATALRTAGTRCGSAETPCKSERDPLSLNLVSLSENWIEDHYAQGNPPSSANANCGSRGHLSFSDFDYVSIIYLSMCETISSSSAR